MIRKLGLVLVLGLSGCISVNVSPSPRAEARAVQMPLHISSVNGIFPVQVMFDGAYQVRGDFLELNLSSSELRIVERENYRGRWKIGNVKVGLGSRLENNAWDISNRVAVFEANRTVSPGESLQLGIASVRIPLNPTIDLSKHWLIVEIDTTAVDSAKQPPQQGTMYAHGSRDMFVRGVSMR